MYLPHSYYPQPPLGLSVASLLLIDHSLLPYVMESIHPMRDVILGGDDYDEMRWGIGIVTVVVMMIMMTIIITMIIMMMITTINIIIMNKIKSNTNTNNNTCTYLILTIHSRPSVYQ